jgi:hypothetical protein
VRNMGQFNRGGRNQQVWVEDYPDAEVFAKDSVPSERPKGSWTNGVKAWKKATSSTSAEWVGWFTKPRLRRQRKANSQWFRPERVVASESFDEEE